MSEPSCNQQHPGVAEPVRGMSADQVRELIRLVHQTCVGCWRMRAAVEAWHERDLSSALPTTPT